MPVSMREALDRINKEDKKQVERVERERKESRDTQDIRRVAGGIEAVKGKSVTAIPKTKERYGSLMDKYGPTGSELAKTAIAGAAAGPMGLVMSAAKMMGSYIKASGKSREEAVKELTDQGVSQDEAESVVNAAIRGNQDITRPDRFDSGRDRGMERRDQGRTPQISDVVTELAGGDTGKYTPIYQPGVGYVDGGYQDMGAPGQMPGVSPDNQIVQAAGQPITPYGGYGPIVPTGAEQFQQTPDMQPTQQPQDFWDIAANISMEGR